jgi:protease IV
MKRKLFISLLTLAGVLSMLIILSILMSSFINRKDDMALSKEKIAVVEIIGTIVDAEEVIEQIERYGEDSSIKAIVLRIDSPGGGVVPSQEIYNEVLKVRKKGKKVVVSMGSVAASGGYYIASASNKIIANPGTITGSIGVLMEFSSVEELMRKVGLKTEIIKSGKFKGLGAPTRSLTAEEKEVLKRVIDDVYEQFVNAVARGRNLPVEKVKRLADGRIYSGKQSIELGLVDGLGNLQDAISETAKMIGIKGKPRIVKEKIKDSWLYRLLNGELFSQYFSYPANQFNFKFQYIWLY